jgi:hypothetical protein
MPRQSPVQKDCVDEKKKYFVIGGPIGKLYKGATPPHQPYFLEFASSRKKGGMKKYSKLKI